MNFPPVYAREAAFITEVDPDFVKTGAVTVDDIKLSKIPTTVLLDLLPDRIRHTAEPYVPPMTVTEERVIAEFSGHCFLAFGLTVSQISQRINEVRKGEVIHVVSKTGSSLEYVITRRSVGRGQFIEVQGPAIGTTSDPASPLGMRFLGVGLTSDYKPSDDERRLSYTFEIKATDRSVAGLAALGGPGAAKAVANALRVSPGVTSGIMTAFKKAIPIIGVVLAIRSIRNAIRVCRDPEASTASKVEATAYAVADSCYPVFPIASTIASVGVGLVSLASRWLRGRLRRTPAE